MGSLNIRRIEAFLARVFIALISVLLALIIAEIASRFFITTRSPIEQRLPVRRARYPKPYVMHGPQMGYRPPVPKMPKDPSEFRVFMLGGSTVLIGRTPLPEMLQNEFHAAGYNKVMVYNYGVLSSVSGMELARIVYEISDLQADLILMYNGGNDIITPWQDDPRPGYPFNFAVFENNPLEYSPESYPAFAMFAYGTNLGRFFLHDYFIDSMLHLDELKKQAGYKSDAWQQKIADIYVSNAVKSSRISTTFGAEFVLWFQPLVYFKPELSKDEKQYVAADPEEAVYARDLRKRILSGLEKTTDLKWKDYSLFYNDMRGRVFTDMIHTTSAAKKPLAHAMFQDLLERFSSRLEGMKEEPKATKPAPEVTPDETDQESDLSE